MKTITIMLILVSVSMATTYTLDRVEESTAVLIAHDLSVFNVSVAMLDSIVEGGCYTVVNGSLVFDLQMTAQSNDRVLILRTALTN